MTGPADSSACPDADWWLEDPELWPLLAFVGTTDADGLPVDPTWKDRQQVLEDLIRRPGPINLDFARYLLVQETHSHGHSWGFRHGIEIAAILVAEHRQVQDVWLLWDAVYRSFDTWGVMPHQFLFAAGVEATRQYVANSDHPQRDLLAEDLRKLADATDEHVEHLIAARRFYYTEALAELDEPATVAPGSAANDTTGRP